MTPEEQELERTYEELGLTEKHGEQYKAQGPVDPNPYVDRPARPTHRSVKLIGWAILLFLVLPLLWDDTPGSGGNWIRENVLQLVEWVLPSKHTEFTAHKPEPLEDGQEPILEGLVQ